MRAVRVKNKSTVAVRAAKQWVQICCKVEPQCWMIVLCVLVATSNASDIICWHLIHFYDLEQKL